MAAVQTGAVMKEIKNDSDVDGMLGEPEAILLKHGATCSISANARREMEEFTANHPDLLIGGLEVTGNHALSEKVADQLGVPHQSPQLFLLRDGKVAWQAEHYEITAKALEGQLAER
jgi:bacillithiol system protein YtxJ